MHIALVCPAGIPLKAGILRNESLGGSETAFVSIATALAKQQHTVRCYSPLDGPEFKDENNVTFCNMDTYLKDDNTYDVVIYSRDLSPVSKHALNAAWRVLWLHDMPSPDEYSSMQSAHFWYVDEVFFLSGYHKKVWTDKFDILEKHHWITRNGLDMDLINQVKSQHSPKFKKSLLFMSRPERGLITMLKNVWPKALAEISPDLELKLCSYSTPARLLSPAVQNLYSKLNVLIEEAPHIRQLGNLSKKELYRELCRSSALVYPTDFPEISCISVAEAAACGVPVITTGRFALPETLGKDYPGLVHSNPMKDIHYADKFVSILKEAMTNPEPFITKGLEAVANKSWNTVALEWVNHFAEKLRENNTYQMRKPTVAACMIVKNEENDILGCLNSFYKYVDEIHITDTGSTDSTLQLIEDWKKQKVQIDPVTGYTKEYPLFMHTRDRLGHFDDARNQSISYTDADWIFWVDADERLTNGEALAQYLRTRMFDGIIIEQCHFYLDMQPSSDTPVRLFKNKPLGLPFVKESFKEIAFVGAIHEHPMQGDINCPVHPAMQATEVRLAHTGYLTESHRRAKVRTRNLTLLMEDRKKYPNRYSGHVLAMRDLIHMFGWALEQGQLNSTYLAKVVGLYNDHFKPMEDNPPWQLSQMFEHAYKQYQMALQLAAAHQVAIGGRLPFSVKLHVGISYGSEAPTPQQGALRWFMDEKEFKDYFNRMGERTYEKIDDPSVSYDF
jgi:glycosyltransferase involved in cell wall biosynthesis